MSARCRGLTAAGGKGQSPQLKLTGEAARCEEALHSRPGLGFGSGLSGFTPGKRQQGAMLLSTETFRPVGGGVGAARYLLAGFLTVLCLADIIALVASGRRISDRILNTDVYHVQPGEIMPIFPNGKPF